MWKWICVSFKHKDMRVILILLSNSEPENNFPKCWIISQCQPLVYSFQLWFGWFAQKTAGSLLWLIPVLTLCVAEGSGIRADRAGAELEVTGRLSAEHAIVPQLHGRTTPGLFRVHSAASAKCNRRPWSIVWCQVCLSFTRMLTSSPSEFRETVKSQRMGADLHK